VKLAILVSLITLVVVFQCIAGTQDHGTIHGRIIEKKTESPLPYVNVALKGTSLGAATDNDGQYEIKSIPPGTYTLIVTHVGYESRETNGISIVSGSDVTLDFALVDASVQLGDITVYGASLRGERITEAPAAISVLTMRDIKSRSVSGQLPTLLEHEPGVDMVQSGVNDFNVNTRGFNKSLNRRLLVLLDGRDLAVAFLGSQEWNGLSIPIEDLGKLELIRGPGSALYGANAFNGVINILTPSPREISGGKVTIAGGELNTLRTDARYARVSGPWSYKINVGRWQSDTWSVSRKADFTTSPPKVTFEYSGLNTFLNGEAIDLDRSKVASTYGSGRLDYEYGQGGTSTFEGGMTQVENEVLVTGIGRVQVPKAIKPWGRISHSTEHWNVQVWGSGRNSIRPQVSLSTGLPLEEQSFIGQVDVQYRELALDDRLALTIGVSHRLQSVDTKGTLTLDAHSDNMSGLYSQMEYKFVDEVKAIVAGRVDRSTLHATQFSPKIAFVWSPLPAHSFRVSYNRAFQSPNYSELFLYVKHPRLLVAYFGNEDLSVEKIAGYEFGYKGILGDALFVTLDAYHNQLTDFITDLTPGVNPKYPGQMVLPGENVRRTIWSYGNAGDVEESGFEVALNYYVTDALRFNANYAQFGFRVTKLNGLDALVPNAPRYKLNGGVTYSKEAVTAGLSVKYVPSFEWKAGIYRTDPNGYGKILAYTLLDAQVSYKISHSLEASLNVTNLLDRSTYQILGGSLIGRRTIVSLTTFF
jgi:iron complex outermembrane receptor protein